MVKHINKAGLSNYFFQTPNACNIHIQTSIFSVTQNKKKQHNKSYFHSQLTVSFKKHNK